MDKKAFFFRENSLLVPESHSKTVTNPEIPLIYSDIFPGSEVITIPDVTGSMAGDITFVNVLPETQLPFSWKAVPIRQAFIQESGLNTRMLRAFHIAQWRLDSVFCGRCGEKNTDAADELARLCPVCNHREYPRISPAVIVIILNNEGQALLAHNKKFAKGVYSLIAGFNEAGESLEETVARETREETGIEICNIRYITSQPWPFPNSLMAAFAADYASGTIKPDGAEIEDAQWFSPGNLPFLPGPGSVSRLLIQKWIDKQLY